MTAQRPKEDNWLARQFDRFTVGLILVSLVALLLVTFVAALLAFAIYAVPFLVSVPLWVYATVSVLVLSLWVVGYVMDRLGRLR